MAATMYSPLVAVFARTRVKHDGTACSTRVLANAATSIAARIVNDSSAYDGQHRADVLDPLLGAGQVIIRKDGEIGKLARLDRALAFLVEAQVGGIDGHHAQRLFARHALLGPDDEARLRLARDGR